MSSPAHHRQRFAFALFVIGLLALCVIPFLIFGRATEEFVAHYFGAARGLLAYGAAAALLLAGDAVLPVPSSLVGTLAGARMGFGPGALANGLGLALGATLGLAIGRGARFALPGLLPPGFEIWLRRRAVVALLVCRPVPVLAEASLIVAGAAAPGFRSVLLWLVPAQFALGAAYAAAGALERSSPLPGVALAVGTVGIPLVFALAAFLLARRETCDHPALA